MIPHPSFDYLLHRHGSTPEGRIRARAELEAAVRARGADMVEREAATAGRSMRCRTADHRRLVAGKPDGCGNDGSTCICECHDVPGADPQETT